MKLNLTIKCHYGRRRIKNGEKIIVDKRPAELGVEIVPDKIEGESGWVKVNRLLNKFERDLRKRERAGVEKLCRDGK